MARPPKEYDAFVKLTDKLLSVPRSEVKRLMDEHKERAALNPKKRGPKPKQP
jgi:hypothetical protein